MNQPITEATVPIASPGTASTSNPIAAPVPTTPMISNWATPSRPSPSTLPASSCHGFIVASSSSTTRLDFSSTTPMATYCPIRIIRPYRTTTPTNATTWRCWSLSAFGSSGRTSSGGTSNAAATWPAATPDRASRSRATTPAAAASRTWPSSGLNELSTITVPPSTAASAAPERTAARAAPASAYRLTCTSAPAAPAWAVIADSSPGAVPTTPTV